MRAARACTALALAGCLISISVWPADLFAQAQTGASLASNTPSAESKVDAPHPNFTRQKRFQFPINIDSAAVGIAAVQLHASVNRGATWQLYSEQPSYAKSFDVEALRDGEYWFAIKTVDINKNVRPAGETRVDRIVIIDSRPPQIQLSADTSSGQVRLKWQVTDPYLDPSTFTMGYQSGIGNSWQRLDVEPDNRVRNENSIGGEFQWSPDGDSRVCTVRIEVLDKSKNRAVITRRLFLSRSASTTAKKPTTPAPKSTDITSKNQPQIGDTVPPLTQSQKTGIPWPDDHQRPTTEQRGTNDSSAEAPNQTTSSSAPPETGYGKLASDVQAAGEAPEENDQSSPVADEQSSAESSDQSSPGETPPAEQTSHDRWPQIPPGEPLRMTQSRRFHLEYDIESLGPDVVREVQLWGTQDGGTSWEKWNIDRDLKSPFDVQVNEEGIYGFRVVIIAANGLAGELPEAGSPADLWVGYDATAPTAEITDVLYGSGSHLGQLEIRWTAADRRLGDRPITLSFAASPEGPWTTIVTGLPNSGQHYWEIDASVPKQIYLKLECFDEAGNSVQHLTREPVNTAGVFPRARIRSVQPVAPQE